MYRQLITLMILALFGTTNAGADGFITGHLFVANFSQMDHFVGSSVFEFSLTEGKVKQVKQVREFGQGYLSGPGGMAIGGPTGNLFVANIIGPNPELHPPTLGNTNNKGGEISEFAPDGSFVARHEIVPDENFQTCSRPDGKPSPFCDSGLRGIIWGPNGNLFVSVNSANAVFELHPQTDGTLKEVRRIRQPQGNSPRLRGPGGIGFSPAGHLYVSGLASGNVIALQIDDKHVTEVRNLPVVDPHQALEPTVALRALTFDAAGNLYVSVSSITDNPMDATVAVFPPQGTTRLGSIQTEQGLNAGGVNFGPNGHLFVGSIAVIVGGELKSPGRIREFSLSIDPQADGHVSANEERTFMNQAGDIDPRFVVFAQ